MLNPFDDSDLPPTLVSIENRSVNAGNNSAAEQGSNIPVGWKPTAAEPVPVIRCTKIKKDSERCKRWSLRGTNVCMAHGAQLPNVRDHAQAVVEAARMRIVGLADDAVDTLEELLEPGTQAQVRLKAATELLDRAGIKGAPDLAITVEHTMSAADTIAEKLKGMAARIAKAEEPEDLGEILDAEEPTA